MKINNLILKILFLYFFIFSILFVSLYLMMPFSSERFILVSFFNIFFCGLALFISMFFIYKKLKEGQKQTLTLHFSEVLENNKKRDSSNYMSRVMHCKNVIYWICKNIPFILYFLGLIIPIFITAIFREKNVFILCLLSAFGSNIFYIFSRKIF